MGPPKSIRSAALAVVATAAAYLIVAYLLAPGAWRHYERHRDIADLGARTVTAQGIPGDVVNIGVVGSEADPSTIAGAVSAARANARAIRDSLKHRFECSYPLDGNIFIPPETMPALV